MLWRCWWSRIFILLYKISFATSTFDALLRIVRREHIVDCFFQSFWLHVLALDPLSWYWAYKVIDSLFLTCKFNMFMEISPTYYLSYLLQRKTPFYCRTKCKRYWIWWWRISISIMQGTYTRHIANNTRVLSVSIEVAQLPKLARQRRAPARFLVLILVLIPLQLSTSGSIGIRKFIGL